MFRVSPRARVRFTFSGRVIVRGKFSLGVGLGQLLWLGFFRDRVMVSVRGETKVRVVAQTGISVRVRVSVELS